MTKFLYHFFVYNYLIGEESLSFPVINRVISKNFHEFQEEEGSLSSLYELIRLGLIDKFDEKSYCLTQSILFYGSHSDFMIGVNLPIDFVDLHKSHLLNRNLGITIFRRFDFENLDFLSFEYDFYDYIKNLQPLKKVIKNWQSTATVTKETYNLIEVYDFQRNSFIKVNDFKLDNQLYRAYLHNDFYFEYVFSDGKSYYVIKNHEIDKHVFIRTTYANKLMFKYELSSETLILKPYFAYPAFLYKILLMEHLMEHGEFPEKNKFKIALKHINHLFKKLKLNYTKI